MHVDDPSFYFLSSFVCVCVQEGIKTMEEMLRHNTSATEVDIRLTESCEKTTIVIAQVLLRSTAEVPWSCREDSKLRLKELSGTSKMKN